MWRAACVKPAVEEPLGTSAAVADQDLVAPEEPDGAVPEDEDLAYDWDFGSQEGAAREGPAADEAGFEEVDVEEEEDEDLAGGGAEAERWDPEEGEDALPGGDAATAEAAFEAMNAEQSQDGEAEEALLRRLRAALAKWFSDSDFELEPFGSFVTQLGLRESEEAQGRSDLDVVLLFRGSAADTFARKEVRDRVVAPTINALGRWLPSLPGVVVKNVIRHARVPIVMFETRELSVDISVQQPWGVLNSWHLRDLCNSGWPGRLRALARMVKLWAKSKSIHTAKDGSLSSYGYSMLAASFLQGCGGLPAILPRAARADGNPYMDADEALEHVLGASGGGRRGRPAELWAPPERFEPDELSDVQGTALPEELRADVTWSPKLNEHWEPGRQEVFMLIEEPLNGENVARCVRAEGFWAILAEVDRARNYLATARGCRDGGLAAFQALLGLPSLSHARRQLPNGVGLPGRWQAPPAERAKRPRAEAAGEAPPHKRARGPAGAPAPPPLRAGAKGAGAKGAGRLPARPPAALAPLPRGPRPPAAPPSQALLARAAGSGKGAPQQRLSHPAAGPPRPTPASSRGAAAAGPAAARRTASRAGVQLGLRLARNYPPAASGPVLVPRGLHELGP
ncbi:unnamed protein product [Prorocentrum cordatum]|uniref:Poly(A) RNA polymerase mitochondrial-like central palm domain-containing protein n=1 Tax=Prorocentrum cordatum TaxID=2364126 RepID=A0ABN9X8Z8_9DINO|nr:unnamed protein product [Polarella glacialis]